MAVFIDSYTNPSLLSVKFDIHTEDAKKLMILYVITKNTKRAMFNKNIIN